MERGVEDFNKSLDCISIVYMLKIMRRQLTYLLLKDEDYSDEINQRPELGLGIKEELNYDNLYARDKRLFPIESFDKSSKTLSQSLNKYNSKGVDKKQGENQNRDIEDNGRNEDPNSSIIELNDYFSRFSRANNYLLKPPDKEL